MSGQLCLASGQGSEHLQLFVEDVAGHSFLNTKAVGVIDLAVHPKYAILDLGCTKSMGSHYAVNKFMKAARNHGFDY